MDNEILWSLSGMRSMYKMSHKCGQYILDSALCRETKWAARHMMNNAASWPGLGYARALAAHKSMEHVAAENWTGRILQRPTDVSMWVELKMSGKMNRNHSGTGHRVIRMNSRISRVTAPKSPHWGVKTKGEGWTKEDKAGQGRKTEQR